MVKLREGRPCNTREKGAKQSFGASTNSSSNSIPMWFKNNKDLATLAKMGDEKVGT